MGWEAREKQHKVGLISYVFLDSTVLNLIFSSIVVTNVTQEQNAFIVRIHQSILLYDKHNS